MGNVNINNISVNITNICTRGEFSVEERTKVFSLLSDYINREEHDASSSVLEDDEFFKKHLKTFVELSREKLPIPETSSVVGELASSVFPSGNSLDGIKEFEEGLEGLTHYFHDLHRAIAIPELRESGAVVDLINIMSQDDLRKTDNQQHTVLHKACEEGYKEIALALIEKMNVEDLSLQDTYTYEKKTALHLACEKGYQEIAIALMDKMKVEDLSLQDDEGGYIALFWACDEGHEEIACALIKKMNIKDLSLQDEFGCTVFGYAVAKGHEKISLALASRLEAIELMARDESGNTDFSCLPRVDNEMDIHKLCQAIGSSKLDSILDDLFEHELHPDKDREFFLLHPFFIVAPFYSEKHRLKMFAHFSHLNSTAATTINEHPLMQYVAKALENNFSIEELKEQFKTIPDLMKNELLGFFTSEALKKGLKEAFASEAFSRELIVKEVNEFLSKNKIEETWSEELGNFKEVLESAKESGSKEEKAIQDLRGQWGKIKRYALGAKEKVLCFL